MNTIETLWEVWTYDVWGNEEDGYTVNNRFCEHRKYPLTLTVETHNKGTEREFNSASPTDAQLCEVFNLTAPCEIDCDGDDMIIYVKLADDDYPIGELHCVSHESLSPIRPRE